MKYFDTTSIAFAAAMITLPISTWMLFVLILIYFTASLWSLIQTMNEIADDEGGYYETLMRYIKGDD